SLLVLVGRPQASELPYYFAGKTRERRNWIILVCSAATSSPASEPPGQSFYGLRLPHRNLPQGAEYYTPGKGQEGEGYEKIWPVLHHAEYGPARRRADARGTPRQSGKSLQRPGGKRYYDALVVYLYRTDNSGARKSGKIVPFGCMRGQGNGTDPFFLRAGL